MFTLSNKKSSDIADNLPKNYNVLDVGGASAPFLRANHIIDIVPFESVSWTQKRGAGASTITAEDYTQHDICSREPWPFADNQFDYVFCSHVLEDIRDPIWVCSEMIRVSKAGYIEVPSRLYETTINLESKNLAGATHHRWVIDVVEQKIRFTFKYFHIHYPYINKNRNPLPPGHDDMLLKLEWENNFNYFENWLSSGKEIFEYYLDETITEKEKWKLYRKTSPHGFIGKWLRYFKSTNTHVANIHKKITEHTTSRDTHNNSIT